jgi:hypothetical protein
MLEISRRSGSHDGRADRFIDVARGEFDFPRDSFRNHSPSLIAAPRSNDSDHASRRARD